MAAIRFVVEGSETFTTVEGDRFLMEPGDLILTPAWTWHDHINESDAPIIWIDGLDVPLARSLDTMFQEEYEIPRQVAEHEFRSAKDLTRDRAHWYFKWEDTEHRARELADRTPGASDLVMPYASPAGGPTLPTLSCNVHLIRPRARTAQRRHTSCGIYHVVKGAGVTTVGEERIEWSSGDCFVVPNWTWYRHENRSIDDEAFLFFMSDRPILEAFSLYREEAEK
jgi:gentisate 1,2-dioxygenase